METVTTDQPTVPITSGPAFQLVFDKKQARGYGYPAQYDNVRVVWNEPGQDGTCSCVSERCRSRYPPRRLPISTSFGCAARASTS